MYNIPMRERIRLQTLTSHCGYCVGLKRCIDFIIRNADKRVYIDLTNDIYSKDGANAFEIIFQQTYEYTKKTKKNFKCRLFSHGWNTIPTNEMRTKAYDVIKKYFNYNEETKSYINNEIAKTGINSDYISVCVRGNDRVIEEGSNNKKEDFFNVIERMGPNKIFVMTDDHVFLEEMTKRFDVFYVKKKKVQDNKKSLHKELSTQEDVIEHLRTLFLEIELVKRSNLMISNTSNMYDYISYCNPNLIRLIM